MTVDPRNPKAQATPADAAGDSVASKHTNRRRLLKAAALAAPLLITLRGRPAHGVVQDHQSSLGSVGILYGPGAYVTQQDVDSNANLKAQDVGKPVKIVGNKKKILIDPTRRDQKSTEPGKSFPK